jgi:hypothetical protein
MTSDASPTFLNVVAEGATDFIDKSVSGYRVSCPAVALMSIRVTEIPVNAKPGRETRTSLNCSNLDRSGDFSYDEFQ